MRFAMSASSGGEIAAGGTPDEALPVFATVARDWRDPGMDRFYGALRRALVEVGASAFEVEARALAEGPPVEPLIPGDRVRYLAEIAETVRRYHSETREQAEVASRADGLARAQVALGEDAADAALAEAIQVAERELVPEVRAGLDAWGSVQARYRAESQSYTVRGYETTVENATATLSGTSVPRVALPRLRDWGDRVRYLRSENRPGEFPFTAGGFPTRRTAGRARIRRACSPGRGGRRRPTGVFTCWPQGSRRHACPRRLTA